MFKIFGAKSKFLYSYTYLLGSRGRPINVSKLESTNYNLYLCLSICCCAWLALIFHFLGVVIFPMMTKIVMILV